ncbi:MAG: hypothetical protein M3O32_00695 [Actinomycetota bacterium]|nr:hypothetical protein [Actinomycetota bacterium]
MTAPSPSPGPRPRPAAIPPRTVLSRLGRFAVAVDIPPRGWSGAHVWPDTGVLLSMGRRVRLTARFQAHYAGRTSVAMAVSKEVDHLADASAARISLGRVAAHAAAQAIRPALVSGAIPVVPVDPPADDAESKVADEVLAALRAAPQGDDDPSFRHGGEAAVIMACFKAQKAGGRHIMLANDGPASKVAALHGVLTRHAADVIAEFACADRTLDADSLKDDFEYACKASKPPADCIPAGPGHFTCRRADDGTCVRCD